VRQHAKLLRRKRIRRPCLPRKTVAGVRRGREPIRAPTVPVYRMSALRVDIAHVSDVGAAEGHGCDPS